MSRVISIGTAVPGYEVNQDRILKFMVKAYNNETAARKLRILFRGSQIEKRYSAIQDFGSENPSFFKDGNYPDVNGRMTFFKEQATILALDAVRNAAFRIKSFDITSVTHLIIASCTGLLAPGLDTLIMKSLGLQKNVFRIPVNFYGCNASFPAMKIADMIARTDVNSKILIICVELCTLHFQPKNDDDNLLSNSLFGDGAAALLVVPDNFANQYGFPGLNINGFYSLLSDEGKDLMGWNIHPLNFEMILSQHIPSFIGKNVTRFFTEACEKLNVLPETIGLWAIHPGGRKILDEIRDELRLDDDDMACSYEILRNYGNMSSPTVLFILDRIMSKNPKGEFVFAMGFGPGISIDASLFTYA